jgi:hypothetical protein
MNAQSIGSRLGRTLVVLVALGGLAQGALADSRDDDRRGHYSRGDDRRHEDRADHGRSDRGGDRRADYRDHDRGRNDHLRHVDRRYERYDPRWQHYRYYPSRGHVVSTLPRSVVVVQHHHDRYWYGGGVWYRPYGPRYVVAAPPVGIFVSVLPPFYTTVWFGGMPYYYANDAYYVWRAQQRAYEVVDAPPAAVGSTVSPAAEDIFVYPREGQPPEQVAADRYECHRWAADETGFDPTRPAGGVAAEQSRSLREAYYRAMTACLEGRGYSVR